MTLRAEPYFAAAGGVAEHEWRQRGSDGNLLQPQLPHPIKARWEASFGWRFTSWLALEFASSFGGGAHRRVISSYSTAIGFAPGTPDLNRVWIHDTDQALHTKVSSLGPVFSLPIGKHFTLRSRQHLARITDSFSATTHQFDGYAFEYPDLRFAESRFFAQNLHTWHWLPSLGVDWTPWKHPRCTISLEALQSSTARIEVKTILARIALRF